MIEIMCSLTDVKKALALANKAQFLMISQESVSWLGDQIDSKECDKVYEMSWRV